MHSWPEILLVLIIACILIIISSEILDIYEKSKTKNYILRTTGYLMLISGIRIFMSFAHMMIFPKDVRTLVKTVTRESI